MMQKLSSQLLQLSAQDKRVFVNAVEELDTKLMPASSVVQNSSHKVLEVRRNMNQLNALHGDVPNEPHRSRTAKPQQLT